MIDLRKKRRNIFFTQCQENLPSRHSTRQYIVQLQYIKGTKGFCVSNVLSSLLPRNLLIVYIYTYIIFNFFVLKGKISNQSSFIDSLCEVSTATIFSREKSVNGLLSDFLFDLHFLIMLNLLESRRKHRSNFFNY